MDDKLHLAPLENPRRILDIGTGTGKLDFCHSLKHSTDES